MKTFISVGIGLLVGVVIGVVASFKTAEKKADKIIRETLAVERKAMREGKSLTPIADEFEAMEKEEAEKMKNKETKPMTSDFSEESYEEIVEEYKPAKKPYLLEDAEEDDPNYYDSHKYLDNFTEIEIVYDRDRGMVAQYVPESVGIISRNSILMTVSREQRECISSTSRTALFTCATQEILVNLWRIMLMTTKINALLIFGAGFLAGSIYVAAKVCKPIAEYIYNNLYFQEG